MPKKQIKPLSRTDFMSCDYDVFFSDRTAHLVESSDLKEWSNQVLTRKEINFILSEMRSEDI